MKKLNEDISRIKQVMGLLTEEESSASKFEKFANKVLNTDFDTKRIVFQEIPEPPETASREERIDYIMNNRINVRLFFDQMKSIPYISTAAPTTNTRAGVQLRISLAN